MYIDTDTSPVVTLVIPSTVIAHKHPILQPEPYGRHSLPTTRWLTHSVTYPSLLTLAHGLANSWIFLVCQDPCRSCISGLCTATLFSQPAEQPLEVLQRMQSSRITQICTVWLVWTAPISLSLFISCVSLRWEGPSQNNLCSKHLSVQSRASGRCRALILHSKYMSVTSVAVWLLRTCLVITELRALCRMQCNCKCGNPEL